MKVIITGAGGLVGGCLARRFEQEHEVLAPRRVELEVTDAGAVTRFIDEERPQLVVNCTVLGVDECERDPEAARTVNAEAPRALAAAAALAGADFLHFSTNYVFDGEGRKPYDERDEPRPLNVYGRTKEEGERAALDANPRSYVVRTSWVFGEDKESFLSTAHRELSAGRSVRAISDTWASVTFVEDLAARVEEIVRTGRHGLYHVVNEGVCTYEDFAREAARLAGLNEEEAARLIETVTESEVQRPARRPRYTPLHCMASAELGLTPLRQWRAALAAYVTASTHLPLYQ
ncbi:MAG: dTDP-4-dehydrorhamnose reductase [Acidobacteriota bacterium]|jgi:dTDP-4-dehydrorhamnose reductase|nr:dTDP-4-dehydrorhamnose reductase [Acidobacteriota bacterium]